MCASKRSDSVRQIFIGVIRDFSVCAAGGGDTQKVARRLCVHAQSVAGHDPRIDKLMLNTTTAFDHELRTHVRRIRAQKLCAID